MKDSRVKIVAVLLAFLLPLAALPAGAQPLPDVPTIQVPAGGATVTGQVTANGRNVYRVSANSLQALSVAIASPGNNAMFQVYDAGASATGATGSAVVSGTTLSGARTADASMAWIGVIPQTGMYLIAVDSKGGAASYTLTVQFQ
ncbi:MAG: hypothetical protein EXR12_09165 [Rhodospirillaceae bacterium]|nr:hypothetical protein [Rhodospirillaceae bacterium]